MFTRSEINQARHSLTRDIINSGYSFHLFSSQDTILKVKAVATDTWTILHCAKFIFFLNIKYSIWSFNKL